MRILFDHQIFSLQKYGGISRYFYELANHIDVRAEHQVNIFAPLYINEYLPALGAIGPKGKKMQPMSGLGRAISWTVDNTLASIKKHSEVDVFHETYYSGLDCCPRSAKRIITIHDMIYEKFADQLPAKNAMRKTRAQAVSRADHIICVSENTKKDLVELLAVSEEKITVVYHGCKPYTGKVVDSDTSPYILYVGERSGYKNFEKLLYAYSASDALKNNFSLLCFGGGSFNNNELLKIKKLGLTNEKVHHLSGADDVLFGLYRKAALFVYPSLYEGFGMPLLEAMNEACPIICSNASCLPEIAGDAAYYFDPLDDSLTALIEKVIFSKNIRTSLIQKGSQRVKEFTWEKTADQTLLAYAGEG